MDRISLAATFAIYKSQEEKPCMRWNAEINLGLDADKNLGLFRLRSRNEFGIQERCCSELQIKRFKVSICAKDLNTVTKEFPKGRVLDIDTNDQWEASLPKIIKKEREIILKVYQVNDTSAFEKLVTNNENPNHKRKSKGGRPPTNKKEEDKLLYKALKM